MLIGWRISKGETRTSCTSRVRSRAWADIMDSNAAIQAKVLETGDSRTVKLRAAPPVRVTGATLQERRSPMLRFLTVKDFAIIDHAELAFGTGMTVLSGETGAGKSLIVDA